MSVLSPSQSGSTLWLPFSEGTGTTVYDYSGNAFNGTITGANWVKLEDGSYALDFNGTSDYVVVTRDADQDLATWTLGCWAKPNTMSATAGIFTKNWDGSNLPFNLEWNNTGQNLSAGFYSSSTANYATWTDSGWDSDSEWTFIVATYDGTDVKIYVNTVLEDTHTATTTLAYNTKEIGIGARTDWNGSTSNYFNGLIRFPFLISGAKDQAWIDKFYQDTYIN